MRVDRERFLLLAASLAAGCTSRGEQPTAVVPVATIEPYRAANDPLPEPTPTASDADEEPLPPPQGEGFIAAPSQTAQCRGSKVARAPGAGCNDNVGRPGDCGNVKLPQGCQSFRFICDQCESYKKFFKPRVAERAVQCVVAQRGSQLDDGCRTYACGDEALQSACLDPAADAPCKSIAQQCGVTLDECRGLLSGMNAAGRARVAACASHGCSDGLWPCIEGL